MVPSGPRMEAMDIHVITLKKLQTGMKKRPPWTSFFFDCIRSRKAVCAGGVCEWRATFRGAMSEQRKICQETITERKSWRKAHGRNPGLGLNRKRYLGLGIGMVSSEMSACGRHMYWEPGDGRSDRSFLVGVVLLLTRWRASRRWMWRRFKAAPFQGRGATLEAQFLAAAVVNNKPRWPALAGLRIGE